MVTTQVFKWSSIFRRSVTPVEDAKYLGHQTTRKTDEYVDQVKEQSLLISYTRRGCEAKSPCWCLTLSVRKCVRKENWKVGFRVGFSTMKMQLFTLLSLCMNFRLKEWLIPDPPCLSDLLLCDFCIFPYGIKWKKNWWYHHDSRKTVVFTWQVFHFTECFEWWCDGWACWKLFQGDDFEGTLSVERLNVVMEK